MTFQEIQVQRYEKMSEHCQREMDKIDDKIRKSLCDVQNARMADRKIRLRIERDNYLAAVKDTRGRDVKNICE